MEMYLFILLISEYVILLTFKHDALPHIDLTKSS